jgi:hypothetical protein
LDLIKTWRMCSSEKLQILAAPCFKSDAGRILVMNANQRVGASDESFQSETEVTVIPEIGFSFLFLLLQSDGAVLEFFELVFL